MAYRYPSDPRRSSTPYPQQRVPGAAGAARRRVARRNSRGPSGARSPALIAALAAVLGGVALLFLAVAAVLAYYAYFQITGRIVPGVRAGGMSLGNLSMTQAASALYQAWNAERKLVVGDGLHTWQVAPADLGLQLNAGETVQNAYTVGHTGSFLVRLDHMVTSLRDGWEIVPVVTFDPVVARIGLEALSGQASQPPVDASLVIQGGRAVPVPGEIGYTYNIEEALSRLAADPRAVLQGGQFSVNLMPVPPRISDVSAAIAEAERLMNTPVVVKAYDPVTDEYLDLPVSPEAIGSWLKVEPGEAGPEIQIDETRVTATLNELSGGIGPERFIDAGRWGPPLAQAIRQGGVGEGVPYVLVVNHNPTTYTIQPGDTLLKLGWNLGIPFWMISRANPGLDPENLWAGQQITIPSKDELLPLPPVIHKRIVISISNQRLWAYENGAELARHPISTGIDRSPTQPGVFQVQTHVPNAYASVWDLHMPDFLGIYEAWPGFMNGIHGLPTLSNGRRLWGNILGRPASYGCIILDLDASQWLYNWAEDGVVVEIRE